MDEEEEVILVIEDIPLKCRKQELIKHSDYFKVMFEGNFAERHKTTITLGDIDLATMKLILKLLWEHPADYLMDEEDVLPLLEASCMFQFTTIRESCINALTEHLNVANCIKVWLVCESLGLRPLYLKAKNLALIEFTYIKGTNSLQDLNIQQLHAYLSNVSLQCSSELEVFAACMQWYYENDANEQTLISLLSCVDFNGASLMEISEMFMQPDIYNNKQVGKIFRLIIAMKSGADTVNNPEFDEPTVNIARKCLNSTKRSKTYTDPVFFLRTATDKSDNGDNNEASSENVDIHYDKYKRKRKYMRLDDVTEETSASLVIYDMKLKKYVKCIDIPQDKYIGYEGFHIMGYKEQIFMFGGEVTLGSGHWNLNFWVYDTIRERWERKTRLPSGRRHFNSCICGSHLYIIGGTGTFRIIQDNMYWYNYKHNIWSTQLLLPCPARQLKCCNHNGQLLLLNVNAKCAYLFDNVVNRFIKLDFFQAQCEAPYPEHFSVFSYNNRVYLKSGTLIEFDVLVPAGRMPVTNVWPLFSRQAMNSDSMESIVCNDTVLTLFKCSQTSTVQVELMSMETKQIETLSLANEDNFDLSTKLFTLQHHYKMVEVDTYVNHLNN